MSTSNAKAPVKNAYQKRLEKSIPAPLENDSEDDPDFIPGAYVPETTSKKKKRGSQTSSRLPGKRPRADVSDASDFSSSSQTKKRRVRRSAGSASNPLLKYFGPDTFLARSSVKEEENDHADEEGEEEEEEEEEADEEADSAEEDDLPPIRKTLTAAIRPKSNLSQQVPEHAITRSLSQAEDSVTESESDSDRIPKQSGVATSAPGATDVKMNNVEAESETESDSDTEMTRRMVVNSSNAAHIKPTTQQAPPPQENDSDSVTESESEDEETILGKNPKPNFLEKHRGKLAKPFLLDEKKRIKIPAPLNTYLRDYQRDGITFLYKKYNQGEGGVLGDDMGKTTQVIGFLSAIQRKEGTEADIDRRHKYVLKQMDREDWRSRRKLEKPNAKWPTCLIIAPNTVVLNWEREFEKWGYFEVGVYAGPDRADILRDFKYGRLDVVVTSFQVATRDIDLLDTLDWSCIIVDEVHQAKNVQSKVSHALHQFTCVRRFGLTGTTIQNSYKEMWSILDWTNPGKLGTLKQWDTLVAKPLAVGQSASATPEEQAFSHHVAQTLRNEFLPNLFLRRTKDIIKDQLPTKHDNVVFCPLTPMQIEAYKRILALDAVRNFLDRDKDCPCGSKKARQKCCHPFVVGDVFKFMSILLKLSNHLALILPGNPNDSPEQIVRNRELAAAIFPNGTPIYELAIMQPQYCGKWMALEALLAEWRQDPLNKILIFTKSVKLLDMFEFNLNKKRETGYKHLTLSGATPKDKRMDLIEQFNNDPSVKIFLISIQTGGTGLNLIGANKVVIFDPNWNPAHDMQAMDRAFRFGQTRDVSVYRLLGAGSIEELIYARQIYKQQQMKIAYDASVQTRYFQGVQGDNSNKGELFGLENIFKLHEGELATKRAIERANLAELDWALANLVPAPQKSKHAGKTTGPSKGGSVDDKIREQLVEASGKFQNDDFLGNAKGLSSLLFDERIPDTEHEKIQKTLNQIGVAYSHKNDEILVPSKIEEARTKELIKKSRQKRLETVERKTAIKDKKGKEKAKERQPSPPKPIWPPIRKHHKLKPPPPTPQEQLQSRRKALIRLELIRSPADLPSFASEFAKMSEEEQRTTIAQLDDYMANHPCSDSESSS